MTANPNPQTITNGRDSGHSIQTLVGRTTAGEATVDCSMSIRGVSHIAVGILGTKKCIAICGLTGAPDEEESFANAVRIATDWNARNAKAANAERTREAEPS